MSACPTPGKLAHETREAALTHRQKLATLKRGAPDLQVYRCQCGAYHVGHSQASLRNRIRRALNADPPKRRRHPR